MTRSCPGRSLRRSRKSFGMTTWNFGDTLTVCMGLSYGNHIDTVFVCQCIYRSLYRTTVAQSYPGRIKTRDAAGGPERKLVRPRQVNSQEDVGHLCACPSGSLRAIRGERF